jgi:CheY-like chemotaxis protein
MAPPSDNDGRRDLVRVICRVSGFGDWLLSGHMGHCAARPHLSAPSWHRKDHLGGWHILQRLPIPWSARVRPACSFIDDDPNLAEIVSALLAAFGYAFEGADGPSGLARFDSGAWGLVLVDLGTPEASSWEVVQTIRQRAPATPVVVLTAFSNAAALRRGRACRVHVIAKPFRLQTLKATLVEALYATFAESS